MWELFVKINRSTMSFGMFTTENLDKAIEVINKEYPDCQIHPEPVEADVLRINKIDKPFRVWDFNE